MAVGYNQMAVFANRLYFDTALAMAFKSLSQ